MIKLFCDECGDEIDTQKFDYFKVKIECVPRTTLAHLTRPYPMSTEKELCEYCGSILIETLKGEKK